MEEELHKITKTQIQQVGAAGEREPTEGDDVPLGSTRRGTAEKTAGESCDKGKQVVVEGDGDGEGLQRERRFGHGIYYGKGMLRETAKEWGGEGGLVWGYGDEGYRREAKGRFAWDDGNNGRRGLRGCEEGKYQPKGEVLGGSGWDANQQGSSYDSRDTGGWGGHKLGDMRFKEGMEIQETRLRPHVVDIIGPRTRPQLGPNMGPEQESSLGPDFGLPGGQHGREMA